MSEERSPQAEAVLTATADDRPPWGVVFFLVVCFFLFGFWWGWDEAADSYKRRLCLATVDHAVNAIDSLASVRYYDECRTIILGDGGTR